VSTVHTSSLLVAIANGRQYGNGAVVAPHAQLDDGLLDLIIVTARSMVRACLELPMVFMGKIDRLAGVTMQRTDSLQIVSAYPIVYHVDGEPIAGMLTVSAKARPRALRMKVPAG
jgi:diacylglycerol kinase (ATP)